MPYKIENGAIVMNGNLPVFIHPDGHEAPFDADSALSTIKDRNKEAKENREARQAAEATLKKYEGIDDPAAAVKALQVIKSYTPEQLAQVGRLEEIKGEINKTWEGKLTEVTTKAQTLEQRLHRAVVGGAFAASKFITDKTVLTPDIAESFFGKHFKVDENGAMQCLDERGNAILSRIKPGEPAQFDEAIEILVNDYPRRDTILRGDNRSGGGAKNADGTPRSGANTIKRQAFDALDHNERRQALAKGTVVVD